MKPISAPRALLFFSFFVFITALYSCMNETNNRFNLEEIQELERDSILSLLNRSKILIEKEDLHGAIATLDSIIKKFGTHDEVERAYRLRDSIQIKYVLKNIIRSKSIDSLFAFIEDYDIKEIKNNARERIDQIVSTTDDPQILQDFLESNRLPEFRNMAKRRQQELLAQQEKDLYAKAEDAQDAQTWKDFVKLYPDHPKSKQINEIIIKLGSMTFLLESMKRCLGLVLLEMSIT